MRCGKRLPPELAGRDDLAWHGVAPHRFGEEGFHIWTPEQLAQGDVGRVGYVLCEPQEVA